jgi:hypothetical protein
MEKLLVTVRNNGLRQWRTFNLVSPRFTKLQKRLIALEIKVAQEGLV